MSELTPLETLFDQERGPALPLPPELERLYGRLQFPEHTGRPYLIGNFVETLDGVTAVLGAPKWVDISGSNAHDHMVMGLLRACADAVIVGAGTLRDSPRHLWTPSHIHPQLTDVYRELRQALGKAGEPLNVIVTASGSVDLTLPVFRRPEIPALIVTTAHGEARLRGQDMPPTVTLASVPGIGRISAHEVLNAVSAARACELILVEGGAQLMGDFLDEKLLDELFLTLAPQVAGRDGLLERPSFVSGKTFLPAQPLWATLLSVKRAGSHLFLRYAFEAGV